MGADASGQFPLPLAITMGEPAGVGGELTLRAWLRSRAKTGPFFAIDDPDRRVRALGGARRQLS